MLLIWLKEKGTVLQAIAGFPIYSIEGNKMLINGEIIINALDKVQYTYCKDIKIPQDYEVGVDGELFPVMANIKDVKYEVCEPPIVRDLEKEVADLTASLSAASTQIIELNEKIKAYDSRLMTLEKSG